jgi:sugar lactone lactonase YvrE
MNTNILKRAREASPGASSGRRAAGAAWTAVLLLLATTNLRAGVPNGVVVGSVCGGGWPPTYGYVEGNPVNSTYAHFHTPIGLALDSTGEYLFVADRDNNKIRVVDLSSSSTHYNFTYTFAPVPGFTPPNVITNPVGVALDADDNVYVLNRGNGTNGTVAVFDYYYGEFLGTNALALTNANGITLDNAGNVYVTASNNLFRIIFTNNFRTSFTTNVATVTNAGACLQGLVVMDSRSIAACDSGTNGNGIYLINPDNRAISKLTGFHGPGDNNNIWETTPNRPVTNTIAKFNQPMGLAKAGNNMLVVADYGNNRVKVVDSNGTVTNLYGVNSNLWCGNCAPDCTEPSAWPGWYDGPVVVPDACGDVSARLPNGVLFAPNGTVYVTEDYYHLIRTVTGAKLPPLPPPAPPTLFSGPRGLALNSVGGLLYIADQTNNAIQALNLANNLTSTFLNANNGISQPVDVAIDSSDNLYVLNQSTPDNGFILKFDRFGNLLGTNATKLALPTALKLDGYGSLFVTEQGGTVQQFTSSGSSNTLATITTAGVQLQGLALFNDGTIAVSDARNHVIWQINPVTKAFTLLTGMVGSPGTTLGAVGYAKLNQPHQLARAAGNLLVAADYGNNRLVVIDRSGSITNVLNSTNALVWYGRTGDPHGSSDSQFAPMVSPVGVALGNDGGVYASEVVYDDIRKILSTGLLPAPPLPLQHPFSPMGIALDTLGAQLYIADLTNNAVQVLHLGNNQTETFLDTNAGILQPVDVVVDSTNNVYVLNQGTGGNGSILEFDQYGNLLRTNAAGLALPTALTMDSFGNIFVTEKGGAVQQFSSGSSNTLFTITNAGVQLQGIALFSDGTIAVSDAGNDVIWQVNPVTHAVTLLTGTLGVPGTTLGSASFAKLNQPYRLARAAGNLLVTADSGNNRLVVVDRAGSITNVLNSTNASVWYGRSDDPQTSSGTQLIPMVSPVGVVLGNDGGVYASEVVYDDIRKISTPLRPPPPLPLQHPFSPMGIALDTSGAQLYIADPTNNALQELHLGNNQTETFLDTSAGILQPVDVVVDSTNNVYVLNQGAGGNGFVLEFDQFGNLLATRASGLALPTALTMDISGNFFVAEKGGAVLQFNSGSSTPLFTITNANVQLQGIASFDDGTVAVSDAGNHVIWQFNPATHAVTLLTGTPGVPGTTLGSASFAKLNQPYRLARAAGNLLVAADSGNNRLVVVDRAGSITNVLNSTNASVWYGRSDDPQTSSGTQLIPMLSPVGLAVGNDGGVYASEVVYHDIRKLPSTGLLPPPPLPPPMISPNSGYYPMGQIITVSSPNPSVYYTGDGSEPTTNSLPVTMSGNVGHIKWFNSTNDLRVLRVKAITAGAASDTVAGQPATMNTIGVPPDFNPAIYAGIGSQIVVPVVVNLSQANAVIQSCQFRVEISPNGSAQPISSGFAVLSLGAGTNDFIPLASPVLGGRPESLTVSNYSIGSTAGLEIAALGPNAMSFQNFAVVALLRIAIPYGTNTHEGDSYALAVSYPSATADGWSDAVPLTPMAPATILVTNVAYKVGDSALMSGGWSRSGGWYNAGGFGNGDLDNSDANLAFIAASGGPVPFAFSDVFNAMDAYPVDGPGFVGGDGLIRYLDWNVILQRSLRLDTNNWARAWSAGGNLVDVLTTLTASNAMPKDLQPKSPPPWPWYRQALIGAVSTGNAVPGRTVNVPVYVKLSDGAILSGIQFRAVVTPQGGAPSLAGAPQLSLASGVPGPTLRQSFKASDAGFGWALGSFNYLSRSSNFLGWVTFTIPASAQSGQTYSVSFANADGAPNLSVQYDFETRSAWVAVGISAPPATICSDEWRIHFFGSLANPSAGDLADADGDGVPNWMEYLAGTDPTDPNSRLQLSGAASQAGKGQSQMALRWLAAPGKAYEVQWSSNPSGGSWSTLTTVSGDGTVASCSDTNITATVRYYRLHVLP